MEPAEKAAAMDILAEQVRVLSETVRQVEAKSLELQQLAEPEPDVPLPERFSGVRTQYPSFKLDCELLFVLKPRTYARDFVKVRAAITLMSGKIKSWAHQLLLAEDPSLLTWDAFVGVMDAWVDRSQPRNGTRPSATSRRRLRLPKEAYHSTFPRPASEGEHPHLHPEEPQEEFPNSPLIDVLDEEEPMILGCAQMSYSQREQARRRHLGLCFYCGHSGHFISFCPVRPLRAAHRGMDINYPVRPTHTVHSGTSLSYPVTSSRPEMGYLGCAYCCPCPRPREVATTEVRKAAAVVCSSTPFSSPAEALLQTPEPSASTPPSKPVVQKHTHRETVLKQDPVAPKQSLKAMVVASAETLEPEDVTPCAPELPDAGLPELYGVDDPYGNEVPRPLMFASNGTLIYKEKEKVFEAALKARAGGTKKKSRSKHK